ncbi:hypothetical protein E1H12_02315 [Geitlerinema sp. P-1104]|uniref:hypothetical protein n=1 Tax=Geitlerinema sp. P-1104 TaxID=2546230 RepID=UPI0016B1009F|nr:hypothetical protein [Geitlerinema sp. P-1104]NMG57380.1 hypothetical protein [Geitlerinema sp. P-1104]
MSHSDAASERMGSTSRYEIFVTQFGDFDLHLPTQHNMIIGFVCYPIGSAHHSPTLCLLRHGSGTLASSGSASNHIAKLVRFLIIFVEANWGCPRLPRLGVNGLITLLTAIAGNQDAEKLRGFPQPTAES